MTTTNFKPTAAHWQLLRKLIGQGGPFEIWTVGPQRAERERFYVLINVGWVAEVEGEQLALIRQRLAAEIGELKAAAHAALDAGDYSQVKSLLSEIGYKTSLLADDDPWYRVTGEGLLALEAHDARVAKKAVR